MKKFLFIILLSFLVKTEAIFITITFPQSGSTVGPDPIFMGRSDTGNVITFTLDNAPVSGGTEPDANGQWNFQSQTLTDGPHTLTAKATDLFSNTEETSVNFNVNQAFINITSPTNGQNFIINKGVRISIQGVSSTVNATLYITVTSQNGEFYDAVITSSDANGNFSTSVNVFPGPNLITAILTNAPSSQVLINVTINGFEVVLAPLTRQVTLEIYNKRDEYISRR